MRWRPCAGTAWSLPTPSPSRSGCALGLERPRRVVGKRCIEVVGNQEVAVGAKAPRRLRHRRQVSRPAALAVAGLDQDRSHPFASPAVPQRRPSSRRWVGQHPAALGHDPARIATDDDVGAFGDRDGPLGRLSQRQARHAEHRRLLLHTAGVGEHHPGARLQGEEVEVPGGLDQADPRRHAVGGHPLSGAGMDGEHQRQLGGELAQRAEQVTQHGVVVDVGRAVQRHQPVAAGLEVEVGQGRARFGPLDVDEQGVDHGVADEVDLVVAVALGAEVVDRVFGRGQEQVAHPVGHHPVDLLGHRPVTAAQPGLHVGNEAPGLGGHQGARQRGVHVPHHHHGIRRQVVDQRLEADHHLGRLLGVRPRPHPQEVVGLSQAEVVEEDVVQGGVVVLAGVHEHGVDVARLQRIEHRLDLHVVGPGPGHADDAHEPERYRGEFTTLLIGRLPARQTGRAVGRIFLSPPDVGADERALLLDAFDSNWIAPLGPHVDAFEREFADVVGVGHAVALSSGTAALHLALILLGVGPGDEVLVPTLTFVATANAVRYVGARPVFVDSDPTSWNIDPDLVAEALAQRAGEGRLPKALVTVDLYGQCADYERLEGLCAKYGIPLIEDAAEALGASYGDRQAGSFGRVGIFSFNGNKIITTSGGGMLVTDDRELAARARHLATQAREPARHYEHVDLGFNYRMSNLLAAVGRGQVKSLPEKVVRRRAIFKRYATAFADAPGIAFMPEAAYGRATRWLTVALVDEAAAGVNRDELIDRLEEADIEARPAWKPMHLQPLFADAEVVGGTVAAGIFARGICLPSGSAMSDGDVDRVVSVIRAVISDQVRREVPA